MAASWILETMDAILQTQHHGIYSTTFLQEKGVKHMTNQFSMIVFMIMAMRVVMDSVFDRNSPNIDTAASAMHSRILSRKQTK